MGLLIAVELLTLRFAMTTLSSVRAFVGGEGLWSKAQKSAVLQLHKYAQTRDEAYYQAYLQHLQIPLGDRQARMEMEKPVYDKAVVYDGFLKGQIDYNDIGGLITLVRRFHAVPALHKALVIWGEGDRLFSEFIHAGEQLHYVISTNGSSATVKEVLKSVDELDGQLTVLENNFSYALGEGSRWLENLLLTILLLAVLTVESTGLILTISFSRNLSRSLRELAEGTAAVGLGDFSKRITVQSRDEIGQLASALNAMTGKLEESIGGQREAEKASEVKSLFLANMSHEIRTPLGAMLGFAELLKDKDITPQEHSKYLEIILRTGNNLSKILHDILDLSKVEAGQIEIEKTRFSLPELLRDIRQVMEIKCLDKSIHLVFNTAPDVPEFIYTDAFRLRQILTNIIGNAIKFTDKGMVTVTTHMNGRELSFLIEDSGIGLTQEQSQQLFQAFSQANNSMSRKYEGTGLGLILSRRLASLLGGDVSLVRSEPGRGSLFSVSVQLDDPGVENLKIVKADARIEMDHRLKGKKILLVDDAADNRFLVEKLLTKRGILVDQAVNGAEGVDMALKKEYDLVLMDVRMPVMDGHEAVRQLRDKKYSKPIIALTAHAMKGDRLKCIESGYTDYLTKPIQVNEFMQVLISHLI